MGNKRFKFAGSNYVTSEKGTIKQAKAGIKKEARETLKYMKDIKKDVGLTPIQKHRFSELKRIIRAK